MPAWARGIRAVGRHSRVLVGPAPVLSSTLRAQIGSQLRDQHSLLRSDGIPCPTYKRPEGCKCLHKVLARVGGGALLFLSRAALADGYSARGGYARAFSWTDCHIGAQGGAGLGTSEDALTTLQAC